MRDVLSVGVLILFAHAAAAQSPSLRRTADGHPDLQGTYDIASMTPLERAPGTPLVMTKDEAAALERQRAERVQRLALPSSGDRKAPPNRVRTRTRQALQGPLMLLARVE